MQKTGMFRLFPFSLLIFFFFLTGKGESAVVDSIPILNHYTQNGEVLKRRRKMEKMLLTIPDAKPHIKKAKGARIASNLIGLPLFGVTLGITIAQFTDAIKAVEEGRPISNEFDKFMIPLAIGSEISSFFQIRLNARSNHLTRKGVIAYNNYLCRERGLNMTYDHQINLSELKNNWYIQDSIDMSTETVYYVLRENDASRETATTSLIFREITNRTAGIGATFLVLAIMGAIEGEMNKTYLGIGIGVTVFSISTGIGSKQGRKKAIRLYNNAVPVKVKCGENITGK